MFYGGEFYAIHQKGIESNFDGGIFTNITHEHLDYRRILKNISQLRKFFDELDFSSFAITNKDDKNRIMLSNTKQKDYL